MAITIVPQSIKTIAQEADGVSLVTLLTGLQVWMYLPTGHINATELCRSGNKDWGQHDRLPSTKRRINRIAEKEQIPVHSNKPPYVNCDYHSLHNLAVVHSVRGVNAVTWVHPKLAIPLAMWVHEEYGDAITDLVLAFERGDLQVVSPARKAFTDHVKRLAINKGHCPAGHFLIHEQLSKDLNHELMVEELILPAECALDVAMGKKLMSRVRALGVEDEIKQIPYSFGDHRSIRFINAYPNSLWTEYQEVLEEWKRDRGPSYFAERGLVEEARALGIALALPSDQS